MRTATIAVATCNASAAGGKNAQRCCCAACPSHMCDWALMHASTYAACMPKMAVACLQGLQVQP
eukprot:CAMPEP_0172727112 /NCGR_PEP_ID=MMETSP1074-20121228/91495_1 /TAXON_ID=2916 /ORGANISM="Ceratium fusus, Strain PA161109" /LENGTH=63 /DNA_ID=CAMNT_0013554227 /DNA_START=37 /DNA_END=228 /DNA_ORIENTATION=+